MQDWNDQNILSALQPIETSKESKNIGMQIMGSEKSSPESCIEMNEIRKDPSTQLSSTAETKPDDGAQFDTIISPAENIVNSTQSINPIENQKEQTFREQLLPENLSESKSKIDVSFSETEDDDTPGTLREEINEAISNIIAIEKEIEAAKERYQNLEKIQSEECIGMVLKI